MRGELVIHIGPPKTATTSFQLFFQKLENKDIAYEGIFQPRKENKNSIAKKLYNAIITNNKNTLDEAKRSIEINLESGKNVLISEEMFLVESKENSYKTKLQALYDLLGDFNPTILLFARKPKEVLPSYYAELYNKVEKEIAKNFRNFVESNYCSIYKYASLRLELLEIGFKKILILDYIKLTTSQYVLTNIFSFLNQDQKIILSRENISTKKGDTIYSKPTNLRHYLYHNFKHFKKVPVLKLFFAKGIGSLLPKVQLKRKVMKIDGTLVNLNEFNKEYENLFDNLIKNS